MVEHHAAGALDELVTEAALSRAGSAVIRTTVGRPDCVFAQRPLEQSELALAADEAREARARELSRRLRIDPGPAARIPARERLRPSLRSPRSRKSKKPAATRGGLLGHNDAARWREL